MLSRTINTVAVLWFVLMTSIATPVPPVINYQARLTNHLGQPVTTTQTVTFTFWNGDVGQTGAMQLGGGWSDSKQVCPDANGLYAILIGSDPGNPIPAVILSTDSVWLNVNVGGENLVPRKRITSVAFNVRTDYATSTSLASQATEADQAGVALSVPSSGSVDAAALGSGVVADARIPATILRSADFNASLAHIKGFAGSRLPVLRARWRPTVDTWQTTPRLSR